MAAILFLAALGAGFLLMLTAFFGGTSSFRAELGKLKRDPTSLPVFLKEAENALNQDLDRDHLFIQLYGGVQRLSGRSVIEDVVSSNTVVRLSTGALNFVNLDAQGSSPSISGNIDAAAGLRDRLEDASIPYLYVQAPQKIERGVGMLPAGLEDTINSGVDTFLSGLDARGVDYLDLRPRFEATDDYASWFFRTDHHWRPEAAFQAFSYLLPELTAQQGFYFDPAITDESQYDKIIYSDFFLGSQGKRVGSLYAGADDITRYSPKFQTDLSYTAPLYQIARTGTFDTSVMFPERVAQQDWFKANPYTLYAGGDYATATAVNHLNPDGPRIVLIRDSFACAITPFLSLACSELTTIDLRHLKADPIQTILATKPDLVITLYAPGTALQNGMFAFDGAN